VDETSAKSGEMVSGRRR